MCLLSRLVFGSSSRKRQSPSVTPSSSSTGDHGWGSASNITCPHDPPPRRENALEKAFRRLPVILTAGGGVRPSPDFPHLVQWVPDVELDRGSRELLKQQFHDPGLYTADESKCFELCLQMEAKLASGATTIKAITTKHSMVQASTGTTAEGVIIGRSVCRIRAPAVDVLAFLLDNDAKIKTMYDVGMSTIEQKTLEVVNRHHSVIYLLGRVSAPFQNREFVGSVLWRKESENQFFYVYVPTTHGKVPPSSNYVRAEAVRSFRLLEESPGVTKCTYTFRMDMKGLFPEAFTNTIVIPSNLESPYRPHQYFIQIKEYADFDMQGEDARFLAQIFFDATRSLSGEARDAALWTQFHRTAAFRHLFDTYRWLEAMLRCIVENNKLREGLAGARRGSVSSSSSSSSESATVSVVDANSMVGKAFAFALLARIATATTPEEAVEEWLTGREALIDMDGKDPTFFRSFLTCIGHNLLLERSLGASFEADTHQHVRRASVEMRMQTLEEEVKAGDSTSSPFPVSVNAGVKISVLHHTLNSNVMAVVISIFALAIVYLDYVHISEEFPSIGGMWGDRHTILCVECLVGIEMFAAALFKFERGYMTGCLLAKWPVTWLSYMFISWLAFDNRPGKWSSALMTLSWALGMIATYPLKPSPRPSFFAHVAKALKLAGGHGIMILFIFGQIIPTKLLAKSKGILASLATGIAVPSLTFIARKLFIEVLCPTLAEMSSAKVEVDQRQEAYHRAYGSSVRMFSSSLAITPCVLNYLNASVKLAVLSAVLQMVTEVLGKIYIVYITRKTFASFIAALEGERGALMMALTLASQEPGLNVQLASESKEGGEEGRGGEQKDHKKGGNEESNMSAFEKKTKDIEIKLSAAMLLLAARWNAEIVAEKMGIIVASLIANIYFRRSDGVGLTAEQLILVSAIFYVLEFVTDVVFIVVMDRLLSVPILSRAINEQGIFTQSMLQDSVLCCVTVVSLASCIKMADMVPLPGMKEM